MFEWIKVLHIIAVISWMAGLLYLPRLLVYHCNAETDSDLSETLKIMERRLLKAIMGPAMMVAWAAGLWLGWDAGYFGDLLSWFGCKLVMLVVLTGFHVWLSRQVKIFAGDENVRSAKFFRVMNEVPTVLMIGIVIMVVVKPF